MKEHEEMTKEQLWEWVKALGSCAGKTDEGFLRNIWEGLQREEDICEEFLYYIQRGELLGQCSVEGCTLADILIFQIDHFRAFLDRDDAKIDAGGPQMVLMAFDTMLKMKRQPGKYAARMRGETGTDKIIT